MQKFSYWLAPIIGLFLTTALVASSSSTIGTSISTGGNLTVTGTTTTAGLFASTTDQGGDITLQAIDDITLSAIGLGGEIIGNSILYNFYADSNSGEQGYFNMDATGDQNMSIILNADSVYAGVYLWSNTASDSGDVRINLDAAPASASTGSFRLKNSSGSVVSAVDLASNSIVLDAGGSTDEMAVTTGTTTFSGMIKLPSSATPPAACSTGAAANVYYDTSINEPCYCNGTAWTAYDGTGSCS